MRTILLAVIAALVLVGCESAPRLSFRDDAKLPYPPVEESGGSSIQLRQDFEIPSILCAGETEAARPPTPRTSAAAHVTVTAYCKHCTHGAQLDLPALIEAGHGDTPLLELPLRCEQCREVGHTVVVSGRSWACR